MLKHVYHSVVLRGASPAPSSSSSSSSISTQNSSSSLNSSVSSASSSGGSPMRPNSSFSSNSSKTSWTRTMVECRASSRLSMSENPNAVPMRIYAACLRQDIQYKTVGVTPVTTSEEVITSVLNKCKVRFKDPRLFYLTMEVEFRGPNGTTKAAIKLEDNATPLQLQECYPKGQAKFCIQMKRGSLVRIYDGSNTAGWQYKSIMISEKTNAGELIDILFRYNTSTSSSRNYLDELSFYSLHIEVNDWKRQLDWEENVFSIQEEANRWGESRLTLYQTGGGIPPPGLFSSTSTTSLYDNVPSQSTSSSTLSIANGSPETITGGFWQRRRSKSLSSESPQSRFSTSTMGDEEEYIFENPPPPLLPSPGALEDQFGKLRIYQKAKERNYEFSEAFFV